jgi:hypothetical protein
MDDLAENTYEGQPVVFLEYDLNSAPVSRFSRFWAGYGGGYASNPLVMVDSGNNAKAGPATYIAAYSTMVDGSMARAPGAEVQAFWSREGNKVNFSVKVKNLSGKTLNTNNEATVHVLVYEQAHLLLTDRLVVNTVNTPINSLANNATGTYQLQTVDLVGVDWSKLHYIALVDYIPDSATGKYDMLQAAVATSLAQVKPDQLVFVVDHDATSVPIQTAQVQGPASLTWNASESAAWLTVTSTGNPATPVHFNVNKAALANGWQQAVVTFSSTDGALSDQVTVKAYLGDLAPIFLPMTAK